MPGDPTITCCHGELNLTLVEALPNRNTADMVEEEKKLLGNVELRHVELKESLRRRSEDQQRDGADMQTTSFSTSNAESLLGVLKERRLARKGKLSPLNVKGEPHLGPSRLNEAVPPGGSVDPQGGPQFFHWRLCMQRSTVGLEDQTMGDPSSSKAESTSSLGQTVRDRMRSRLKKKQMDAPPTSSTEEYPKSGLFGLRDQPQLTRFDEPLPSDSSVEPPLPIVQVTSSRWKTLSLRISEVMTKTEAQSGFEFFTGALEDGPPHPEGAQDEVDTAEEGKDEDERETSTLLHQEGDMPTLSQSHTSFLYPEEPTSVIVQPGWPTYIRQREWQSREATVLFTPSPTPVPPEEKTPGSLPPHYLEDDGLFVGQRPNVRWTNQARMENRLLQRDKKGEGWFGEDGLLVCQPSPLRVVPVRPAILAHNEEGRTQFSHARLETLANKRTDGATHQEDLYQLDVRVSLLHFHHHPLFSEEHVIASHLQQSYQKFKSIYRGSRDQFFTEKLHALKKSATDLKQALDQMDGHSSEAIPTRQRLDQYLREVRAVREQKKREEALEYGLLKAIVRTWNQLKSVRETQGYSSTAVWLTFRRQPTNEMEDETQLRRDIDEEVEEAREAHERQNGEKVVQYNASLAEWKTYQRTRRRLLRHSTLQQSGEQSDDVTLATSTNVSLESQPVIPADRPRPLPPPLFDGQGLRRELTEFYTENRRPPGEPILVPELQFTHPISQQCPRAEQLRREELSRVRFKVKVVLNGSQVSDTKEGILGSEGSVHFEEVFNIRIVHQPQMITLKVFEAGLLTSHLLADVFVPIPDTQVTASTARCEDYQFSSNRTTLGSHTAVGSGQALPAFPDAGILTTSGMLRVKVCWSEDANGTPLCPPGFRKALFVSPHTDPVASLGMAGVANPLELKKWIEQSNLDPNDPRNSSLLRLVESIPTSSEEAHHFRLVVVDVVQRFCQDEEFDNNRRFKLLQLRHQGHPGLVNKSIPLAPEAINASFWKSIQDYKPFKDYDLPTAHFGDFFRTRVQEQKKFFLDLREKVLSKLHSGSQSPSLEEVVTCDIVPNIGALTKSLVDFLSPRQPLKPRRRSRRKAKHLNVQVTSAEIAVRVIRAGNLPSRSPPQTIPNRAADLSRSQRLSRPFSAVQRDFLFLPEEAGDSTPTEPPVTAVVTTLEQESRTICPFVEVSFGTESKRTTTACGSNPFWNEELVLPFIPPDNDFSPASLQKVTDVLHISVFDEILINTLKDDRQRGTNFHHRVERRWIGSFTIPFYTLHSLQRIEGCLVLDLPSLMLGYDLHTPTLPAGATLNSPHIQVFITLEPPLSMLPPLVDHFDSIEDPHLLKHAHTWLKSQQEAYPTRNLSTTALDMYGNRIFLTRYITSQNPPQQLLPANTAENVLHSMELLARYVSHIPFIPDAITFLGSCDIWTTSEQFLRMLAGDEEEHAILLCNYFLHLGQRAWLVLGHALPEGPTAYVLTEDTGGGHRLWNPCTGKHYSQYDPYSPLKSVGCVISDQNIWANIQPYEDASRINFDLSNSAHWRQLFSPDMEPLQTIQVGGAWEGGATGTLHYTETNGQETLALQERIDRNLRDHMISLRSGFITRWNRHCARILQSLLPGLEEQFSFSSPPNIEQHTELREIMDSHKIFGYPLHFENYDVKKITHTVEKTGIHLCEDEKVEYSLAVYVHAYPNDIVSIWVFIAALINMRV
ncbi:hypothetical protein EMCRGX_G034349 [Ephydatia muelleri]